MNRTLQVIVGVIAIVAGATLFAMHIIEFSNHLQMRDNSIAAQGFVTEVKIVGGNSELHYEFTESTQEKTYSGGNALRSFVCWYAHSD